MSRLIGTLFASKMPYRFVPSPMMRRTSLLVIVAVATFISLTVLPCNVSVASQTSSPPTTSTTSTTISEDLEDDFLTLFPEFSNDQYEYLLPDDPSTQDDNPPAETGFNMRIGLGALAVLAIGAIMFALSRGPRRRRS